MLRLHFTPEDLGRVRFAKVPDPLWESVLSLTLLGTARGRATFGPWQARLRPALPGLPAWQIRLLRRLVPATGNFPDFLTPSESANGLEAGIEAVLMTPKRTLRRELASLPDIPSWSRPLAEGDPKALTALADAIRNYHRVAITPHWPNMDSVVQAERAARSRTLMDHGIEGLLARLRPTMRWRPPILEVDYPVSHDIHLAGRGLRLIPSVFCWRMPITLIDAALPPVLLYPVPRDAIAWTRPESRPRAIAKILGSTRSACLELTAFGYTTRELARHVGVGEPATSQHLSYLRQAGLITSSRQGNTVLHTITALGQSLLEQR
ncbi:ArsR/SmtB family transcription factor [Streptomyces sp. NBC_01171]|uniref:ArsR/SmtB family transcription factor n=1 Tax=Streptomyces sp. NBC_01171 TaxID=2903757 RepID=UPI00386768D5|nr:helix-turn-helix domain-containing protein [Streptomyces sp. NBC_01171]